MSARVIHGDCMTVMADMPECSVDAIVTDPPYGLGFMGREWDSLPPGREWAEECLRVLKPGGHLLAFGGTRTWHRLACAVEDAGFEVRDSIAWLYGSGFPKSLDVSKAIDKAAPRAGMFEAFAAHYRERREALGLTHREVCGAGGFYAAHNKGGASVNWEKGYNVPTPEQWAVLADVLQMPREMWEPLIDRAEAEREVTGQHKAGLHTGTSGVGAGGIAGDTTAPATPEAEQWAGWGTALKPAFEPIVVARKPLAGTVAGNVLAWGTGALNIDACRVAHGDDLSRYDRSATSGMGYHGVAEPTLTPAHPAGRWPANVALDDTQAAELDRQSGIQRDGVAVRRNVGKSGGNFPFGAANPNMREDVSYGGGGGASRFFYVAKAPKRERPRGPDGTSHPTVKPLALMRWLVRLVTPPGGTTLDPFAGSGTTIEAALLEGFNPIGIEREAEYLPLIQQRIDRVRQEEPEDEPLTLFGDGPAA